MLNKLYVKLCGESSHCNLIKIHTHDKIIDFPHETLLTWNYALYFVYFVFISQSIIEYIIWFVCPLEYVLFIFICIYLHMKVHIFVILLCMDWLNIYFSMFRNRVHYTIYPTRFHYYHSCGRMNVHSHIINSQLHTKYSI